MDIFSKYHNKSSCDMLVQKDADYHQAEGQ